MVVADNQGLVIGVVVDAKHVYWAASEEDRIMRAPIAGGAPEEFAAGQSYPTGMAIDAACVYWVNRDDGSVMKRAK
jgi:sugar lactone lactonase YvrE